jgi:release factor glutamine methyltransferase
MPTVRDLLREAERTLAAHSDSPRLDAELLLAHALRCSRAQLLARLGEECDAPDFAKYVARRAAGEPVAYILGEWEFFSLGLEVEPPALVPRPETEHLVEEVLGFIGDRPARVLDLCTGTGCVAVAIAKHAPNAEVWAADIEPRYAALAARNAERHGLGARLHTLVGDLYAAVPSGAERFDAVCANPPYIADPEWVGLSDTIRRYEDRRALTSGADGLDCVRAIIQGANAHLRAGGLLALEIGHTQAPAVSALLSSAGFFAVHTRKDLAGIERIVAGIKQ